MEKYKLTLCSEETGHKLAQSIAQIYLETPMSIFPQAALCSECSLRLLFLSVCLSLHFLYNLNARFEVLGHCFDYPAIQMYLLTTKIVLFCPSLSLFCCELTLVGS